MPTYYTDPFRQGIFNIAHLLLVILESTNYNMATGIDRHSLDPSMLRIMMERIVAWEEQ